MNGIGDLAQLLIIALVGREGRPNSPENELPRARATIRYASLVASEFYNPGQTEEEAVSEIAAHLKPRHAPSEILYVEKKIAGEPKTKAILTDTPQ